MGFKAKRKRLREKERTSPTKEKLYSNTDHLLDAIKKEGYREGLICDYVYRNNQFFIKNLETGKESPIKEKILRKRLDADIDIYAGPKDILETHLNRRKEFILKRNGVT